MKRIALSKWLSGCLLPVAFALCVFLLPVKAEAASTHTSHPVCGTTCTHEQTHETVSGSRWTGGSLYSGSYYMASSLSLSKDISVSGTVQLCLNGNTLTFAEGYGITVLEGGSLVLCDCRGTGSLVRGPRLTNGDISIFGNHGTLTIYSGTYCPDGEGVSVYSDGTLNIYGGSFGIGISNYGKATIQNTAIHIEHKIASTSWDVFNGEGCTMEITDCSIISNHSAVANKGTMTVRNSTVETTESAGVGRSDGITNYKTLYVYDTDVTSADGNGIDNEYDSGTMGSLYFYSGTVTADAQYRAAIYNRGSARIYDSTLSGYIGIHNGSALAGTASNGGNCTVSGGTISGSLCAIRNSGNTSTRYQNGVSTKQFSRAQLTIEGTPSIGKLILEYPNALTFNYNGTEPIDLELDMDDFVVGDTVWKYYYNKLPLMNLLNEDYVLVYHYATGVTLANNYCGDKGDNLRWKLSRDGVLTIYGTGNMANFGSTSTQPWYRDKTRVDITEVIIEPGVTSIGSAAFSYADKLTRIRIPEGVVNLGNWSFEHCDALEEMWLPASLQGVGRSIFAGRSQPPQTIHYAGCKHQWENVSKNTDFTPVCLPNTNTGDSDCTTAVRCSVCGEIIEPALGHDYQVSFVWSADHTDCTATVTCARQCGMKEILEADVAADRSDPAVTVHTATVQYDGKDFSDTRTCNNYLVVFQNWDGTQLQATYYHPGDAVTAPVAPTREDHEFAGWDQQVAEICLGNAVYTAVFNRIAVPGDFNGDYVVTNEDVIYLLWHTVFPEDHPVSDNADFNGDGVVDNQDVICLLWHIVFPEDYPLWTVPAKKEEL